MITDRLFSVLVFEEYQHAREKFKSFNSGHEGYAVMLEEVEEVWIEVKHPTSQQNLEKELIQVSAMAMAMAVELTLNEKGNFYERREVFN